MTGKTLTYMNKEIAVTFGLDLSETLFTPEELIAMILSQAKEYAEVSAHQQITECVITVPAFFNQAERRAMMKAAELAGLKGTQRTSSNKLNAHVSYWMH